MRFKTRSRRSVFLAIVLVLALVLSGCGGQPAPADKPADPKPATPAPAPTPAPTTPPAEKVLKIAARSGTFHLNPEGSVTRFIFEVTQYAYEQLVMMDNEGKLQPRLAERIEVSPDGLEYTFHLRQGVTFHDGAPWNAAAAKHNLDRKFETNVPYSSFIQRYITEITAPSEYVLKIKLTQPTDDLLGVLSAYPMAMFSPKAVESQDPKWFETNMAGTGPFMLEEWKRGESVALVRNPNYYMADLIKADRILLLEVPEGTARAAMLEAGTVDIAIEVPAADVVRFQNNPDLVVRAAPAMGTVFVLIHCQKEPTNDVRVRQALNYAVDEQAIMKVVFRGMADVPSAAQVVSRLAFPPSWPDKIGDYPYDKEKAAQLLDEAGWKLADDKWRYKDGKRLELLMRLDTRDPDRLDIGQMTQQYLRDVGIRATIELIDAASVHAEIFRKAEDQRHHLFVFGFGVYTGAIEYVMNAGYYHTAAWPYRPDGKEGYYNFSYYSNPEVDRLIDAGNATTGAERAKFYLDAVKIVQEEAPTIQMFEQVGFITHRADVEGAVIDPVVRIYPAYFASKRGW